jgi:medium-chain acyl-[acyl-carrier-protein] hydrolase
MLSSSDRWLVVPRRIEQPRARLICFPHAGAGGWQFRTWTADLPEDVELVAAHLPGHEDRIAEPPLFDMNSVVRELAPRIAPLLTVPTVFFGLSCGARIAAAVIAKLVAGGDPVPKRLVVANCHPPHVAGPLVRSMRNLTDNELVRELKSLSGAPQAFFAQRELVAVMLPAMKADVSVAETMVFDPTTPLPVDVVAMHGSLDRHTSAETMRRWQEIGGRSSAFLEIDGGHFFPMESRTTWLENLIASGD